MRGKKMFNRSFAEIEHYFEPAKRTLDAPPTQRRYRHASGGHKPPEALPCGELFRTAGPGQPALGGVLGAAAPNDKHNCGSDFFNILVQFVGNNELAFPQAPKLVRTILWSLRSKIVRTNFGALIP